MVFACVVGTVEVARSVGDLQELGLNVHFGTPDALRQARWLSGDANSMVVAASAVASGVAAAASRVTAAAAASVTAAALES